MQDEISWNDNTYYSPLEPCDAPKMRKYRPKDDRCTNKQIWFYSTYIKKEIVDKISIEVNIKDK